MSASAGIPLDHCTFGKPYDDLTDEQIYCSNNSAEQQARCFCFLEHQCQMQIPSQPTTTPADFKDSPGRLKELVKGCITKSYDNERIWDLSAMSAIVVVYVIVIIMIVKRRELQPIKLKGWRLICISLVGSCAIIFCDFLIKIFRSFLEENLQISQYYPDFRGAALPGATNDCDYPWSNRCNYEHTVRQGICLMQSLRYCFFRPIFVIPYLLRTMRIYTVFSQHKHYVLKKRRDGVIAFRRIEDTYCIREANLALFFIIALVFFMAALMVNIFSDYEFHKFFPLHNMGQCIPEHWTEDTTGSTVRSNL